MALSTDTYTIENVQNRNLAILTNDNDGDVISGTDVDEGPGHEWEVKGLNSETVIGCHQSRSRRCWRAVSRSGKRILDWIFRLKDIPSRLNALKGTTQTHNSTLQYKQNYFRIDTSSDLGNLDPADFASDVKVETSATNHLMRPDTRKMVEDCAKCAKIKQLPRWASCVHNQSKGLVDTSEVEKCGAYLDTLKVTETFQDLVFDLMPMNASQEPLLHSLCSCISTDLEIVNMHTRPIHLYWLNYRGIRVSYGVVPASEGRFQQTYKTHPWVIVDEESGDVLGIWKPL